MNLTVAVIHDSQKWTMNPAPFLPTTKLAMHTSADLYLLLPSPPTQAHLTHQQASFKHPQHKQFSAPNLPPQPIVFTHLLDAADPIHQPN